MGRRRDGHRRRPGRGQPDACRDANSGGCALRIVTLGTVLACAGTLHAAVNARLLRTVDPAGAQTDRSVCVLIPARDEAANIGRCLAALGGEHSVIVYDDDSRDATASIAAAHGAQLLTGPPPPAGWTGKAWACRQLAAQTAADVLVFLDADVVVVGGGIDAAVRLLDATGLDLVSPQPQELAHSAAERLVQPLLWWGVLTMLPLRAAERSGRPSLSAANGQFLVVRRTAYERAGGHVPDAVLDDIALLRAVKGTGGRGAILDGTRIAHCRMYDGWRRVRDGYGKSLWAAFGSPVGSAAACAALVVAYVVPPLAALRGSGVGLLGYLAAVAGRVVTARRCGDHGADAVAHPLFVLALTALVAHSHRAHGRGRLTWKGRPLPS